MAVSAIAREASALKRRHGDLLAGECSFRETTSQRLAVAALDAAQARLRGPERPAPDQMSLDLRRP